MLRLSAYFCKAISRVFYLQVSRNLPYILLQVMTKLMNIDLKQTHAWVLVTGASSGIGKEIAFHLSQQGYPLILLARREALLKELASQLPTQAVYFQCDLCDPEQIQSTYKAINELMIGTNRLHALINNAGIVVRKPFADTSDMEWSQQFQTNIMGPVRLIRQFLPLLKRSAPASIVNISSTLGRRPIPLTSAYSASKAALISLGEALALELAEAKIRVNTICPGLVITPIHDFYGQPNDSETMQAVHQMQPLGVAGQPEDIAPLVGYCISDQAKWMTGSVIDIDGGIHLA